LKKSKKTFRMQLRSHPLRITRKTWMEKPGKQREKEAFLKLWRFPFRRKLMKMLSSTSG
jgi:hypothetical protein